MARTVNLFPPSCLEDIGNSIYGKIEYQGLYYGITMDKAFVLQSKGLRFFCDIRDPCRNDLLGWEGAQIKFSLAKSYYDFWVKLLEHYGQFRERMCSQLGTQPTSHEWVGLYISQEDIMPE